MARQSKGLFITFEGTEGSGKSTLIQNLSSLLKSMGLPVIVTREPGGSPLAEKIRSLVLSTPMDARTELLLYEAARSEHLSQKILPALNQGSIVLCDRFTDSTLAYQAHARGLPWKEVQTINSLATGGLKPNLTVFLDIDPAIGLARAKDPNRFENEGLVFQKKVRAGYLRARATNPKRWLTIKVKDKSPDQLAKTVLKQINLRCQRIIKKTPIHL